MAASGKYPRKITRSSSCADFDPSIPLLLTPDLPAGQSCFLLFDHTLTSQVEVYDDHRCCCVAGDVTLLGPLAQFLGRLLLVCQELADERHQAGIDLVDWRAALVVSDQQPGSTAWHFGMSAARSVISCAIAARSVDHRSCRAWMRALRLEISNAIVPAEGVSRSSETREQTTAFNNNLRK